MTTPTRPQPKSTNPNEPDSAHLLAHAGVTEQMASAAGAYVRRRVPAPHTDVTLQMLGLTP